LRPTTLRRSVAAVTVGVGLLALANPAGASSAPGPQLGVVAGTGTAGPPTPGPATSSQLDEPFGVAVDGLDNLYVADASNNEVEKVSASGTLSIVAGTGTAGPSTPGPATSSELDFPDGLAVDALGNVFVADAGNYEVDRISSAGVLSVVAGTGTSGVPTPGPASDSQVGLPYGLAVDRLGDVWVADANNNEVEKISPAGVLSIVAGTGTGGRPTAGPATRSDLDFPTGVAVDALGDLFIADSMNNEIEKVTPAGTLSVVAGTGRMGAPTPGAARSSDLDTPYGVTVDGAGDVVIADTFNHEVESVAPSGALSIVAGTGISGPPTPGPATGSELGQPTAVGVDGLGTRYMADFADNDVDRVTSPSGGGQTVGLAAPGSGGLLRASASGHVYNSGTTFYGSPYALPLTSPVAGLAATSSGGYVVATASGHVYAYGTTFHGSPNAPLDSPVAGLAATPSGGYVVATASGHVYAYGTTFHGSPYSLHLTSPVAGIATTAGGDYVVATAAGSVYAYGTTFHGSPKSTGTTLTSPVVGIATTGTGYVVATADGHVYAYGTPSEGSPAQSHVTLTSPIVAVTSTADGYTLATAAGTLYTYTS
jgi:sugar lactone lactonase YvrE